MILRNYTRTILSFVLLVALVLMPTAFRQEQTHLNSPSIEVTRHASLQDVATIEEGHSHEDGEPFERASNHSHGHDPADHSHQFAFMSHNAIKIFQKMDEVRFVHVSDLVKRKFGSGIERPPKLALWI